MGATDNVFLIGYMASGKTAIGKELATEMNMSFADTDQLLTERLGKSINFIFEEKGEEYFRKQESRILEECVSGHGYVISTGGGMPASESNLELMLNSGFVVYLKLPVEELINRLKQDKSQRPLLRDKSDRELESFVRMHFEQRRAQYEKAHLTFPADGSVSELKHQILDFLSIVD